MIEGLKLKIDSSELRQLLQGRAKYHQDRAALKEGELPALRDAMNRITAQQAPTSVMNKFSNSNSYQMEDPVEKLEQDIKDHKNKAVMFEFLAGHLFDDVYSLGDADLQRLEIVRRI